MKLILVTIISLNFSIFSLFTMEAPEPFTDLNKALINAIETEDVAFVEQLLQQGANANTIDPEVNIPVITTTNNEEIMKLLLEYGANPNIVINPEDQMPTNFLETAISFYSPRVIDLLLNKKNPHPVMVDSPSGPSKNTALISAAYTLQWVQNKPDEFFNLINEDPYVAQKALKQIIQKLLDAGADPDKQNSFGVSARSIIPELIKLYTAEKQEKEER